MVALAFAMFALALGPTSAAPREEPAHEFVMPTKTREAAFVIHSSQPGPRSVRVKGISWAGGIEVRVANNLVPADLVRAGGDGSAAWLILRHDFLAGQSKVTVRLSRGVQIFRIAGTRKFAGTSSEAWPHRLFTVDLDKMKDEYNVEVRIAPGYRPLAWFSGKWDNYAKKPSDPDRSFTTRLGEVWTTQGKSEATLHYEFLHNDLRVPTDLTLVYDPSARMTVVRMKQTLLAINNVTFAADGDTVEFLHLVVNPQYGKDWEDGATDYFWTREQDDGDGDALPGAHTAFVRIDDNSTRTFMFNASTKGELMQRSSFHHTALAHPMYAENTIGGWISKQGVGSLGLLFHSYWSTAEHDLTPIHSHCGDGADTHFYIGWGHLYLPLVIRAGEGITTEYSLYALPSELTREQVEDLNEADFYYFGGASRARSKIARWYGTKTVCGLIREDGSATLIGIGEKPEAFRAVKTISKDLKAWRVVDLGIGKAERLPVDNEKVMIYPRFVTIVDAGSGLTSFK